MKRILFILLLVSTACYGQPGTYLNAVGRPDQVWHGAGMVTADSCLRIPNDTITKVYFNNYGNIAIKDSLFYYFDGLTWRQAGSGGGGSGTVTNVSTGYGMLGGPITTTGTVRVDTNEIANRRYVDSGLANIPASFDTTHIYSALADSIGVLRDSLAAIRGDIPPAFDSIHIYTALGDSIQSMRDSLADHWDAVITLDADKIDKVDSNVFGGYTSYSAAVDTAADHLALINSKYPASNPNGYTSNTGTVTSLGVVAGTGVSIGGSSPVTSAGTYTITNTAPDQTVTITASTNVTVTGSYPTFTLSATGGGATGYPKIKGVLPVTITAGANDTGIISLAPNTTQTITETTTINFPTTLGMLQQVTLTANDTIAIDSALMIEGYTYKLTVLQNGTGGKTLYWRDAYLKFSGGTTSTGYPYQDIGANEYSLYYISKENGRFTVLVNVNIRQ